MEKIRFDNKNIYNSNGFLRARRFTTTERKAMNFYNGVVSTAGPIGGAYGIALAGYKLAIDPSLENAGSFSGTATKEVTFGVAGAFAKHAADGKDGIIQGAEAFSWFKTATKVVKGVGTGLSLAFATNELFKSATADERLEKLTFQTLENGGVGSINIANKGVFTFKDTSLSKNQGANVLNKTLNALGGIFSQYDLSNDADVQTANKYVTENFQQIIRDINNLNLEGL